MDKNFIAKFLKGSAFSSMGTVFTIVFHFLSIKILAVHMSETAFGIYSIIIVISHGFQILSGLGLNLTLVKHLSGEIEGDKPAAVSAIFLARLVQLAIVSLLVFTFGHLFLPRFFDEGISAYIIFIPVIFALASFRDLLFHLLQGIQKFNRYAFINIFSAAIRLSAIFYFSYTGGLTVDKLVWVEIITYGVSVVVLLIYAPLFSFFTSKINKDVFKQVFGFGMPLYANDVLTYIYNRISVILIGGLLTPVSVAMYEIASKIPDGFSRLFNSLIVVYFPSMSQLLGEGKHEEGRRFMTRGLILASTGLSLVALVTFLFREEIVLILFDAKYLDAALALGMMMVYFNMNSITRMMGYTIVAAGHSSVPVRINVVSSISNVIGCLILIPRFGFIGAVYSLIIMSVVSQALNYYYLVKVKLKPEMMSVITSVLLMVFLLAGYSFWGNDHFAIRFGFVVAFVLLAWQMIPEVKHSVKYMLQFKGRLRPSGSA